MRPTARYNRSKPYKPDSSSSLKCFLQRRDTGVFDEGSEIGFDGALLVDLWDQMYMRKDIRRAWQPLIDEARGG